MGLSKTGTVISFVSLILVLQESVMTATFQLQSISPNSSLTTLPFTLAATSINESKNKFVMRKCCGPGHLYNYNLVEKNITHADRCVKFSVSSSHRQSVADEKSTAIFLGSKQSFPPRYSVEDVQVDVGFPRNCMPEENEITLEELEPEQKMGDVFYALSSGDLLVPHQFIFLKFDDYCIEDYANEEDFKMARRMAFICIEQTQDFPTTAVDSSGKLRLDFIQSDKDAKLLESKFNGRRVIRKCCWHNHSFDSLSAFNGIYECMKNQGLVTRFFENIQLNEKPNEIFFRFGLVICSAKPTRTKEFQLHSNGSLEIKMSSRKGNSSNLLVSIEDYCLEDLVKFDNETMLPYISTYAFYCSGEEPSVIESEITNESESIESPSTEPQCTHQSFTEATRMSEPGSTYSNNDDQYDNSTLIIPKCCPSGHVMDEDYTCKPLLLWLRRPLNKTICDIPTEPAKIVSDSISYEFKTFHKIFNVIFIPNKNLSSCKPGQLRVAIPLYTKNTQLTPKFRKDSKNGLSVSFHTFVENYWDVKTPNIHPYCVDQLLSRQEQDVSYNSQVFHCTTIGSFKKFHPAILLVSTVALLATFVIYFFVPASGSAKSVITAFGGNTNKGNRIKTMAMLLTGRILLCHVISLALAFTCLAIVNLQLVATGGSSCIVIGYITYWALIASFSWLTVYCYDYYHIFSGSFKVTNDRLFVPYSAFGWGIPILATTIASFVQFLSTEMDISDTVNPNVGYDSCWFAGGSSSALIIFFYTPVGVLLLLDIYFFFSLMFNSNLMYCWQRQEVEIRSNRKISTASKEQEDLKMAVKLFFITGIPWIFEFIAYLVSRLDGSNVGLYYFLECCQLLNTSRGVFIFVNFILLNPSVRKFLWSHIKILFKREPPTPADLNAMNNPSNSDHSNSNLTAQSLPATCSETNSIEESFEYDECTHL